MKKLFIAIILALISVSVFATDIEDHVILKDWQSDIDRMKTAQVMTNFSLMLTGVGIGGLAYCLLDSGDGQTYRNNQFEVYCVVAAASGLAINVISSMIFTDASIEAQKDALLDVRAALKPRK